MDESQKRSLSLRQFAKLINVSPMTASRAMNNSPKVSEATRARVQKAARELGYKRSEAMSKAMASAASKGTKRYTDTIAIVSTQRLVGNTEATTHPRSGPAVKQLVHGLTRRSEELGCKLDYIDLSEHSLNSIIRVLKARGIRHAIVKIYPFTLSQPIMSFFEDLSLQFQCVFVGHSQLLWKLGRVLQPDYYSMGQLALLAAFRAGYRKVLITESLNRLNPDGRFRAGVTNIVSMMEPGKMHIGTINLNSDIDSSKEKLERLTANDCVIGSVAHELHPPLLERLNAPQAPGWIDWHANLHQDIHPFSGIDQRDDRIGSDAIDQCLSPAKASVDLIPRLYSISPDWIQGTTLPGIPVNHQGMERCRPFDGQTIERFTSIRLPELPTFLYPEKKYKAILGIMFPPEVDPGPKTYHGISFNIQGDPATGAVGIQICGGGLNENPSIERSCCLPVNAKGRFLYFFHMLLNARWEAVVGKYGIHFEDGSREEIELVSADPKEEDGYRKSEKCNIQDWWGGFSPLNTKQTRSVHLLGSNFHRFSHYTGCGYILRWQNPFPQRAIQAIDISCPEDSKSLILLFAITMGIPAGE
jgi:DNA-binding LacI/PurR family transcriptional regulator